MDFVVRLFFIAREKSEQSLLYKGYLCKDVFKIIVGLVIEIRREIKKWISFSDQSESFAPSAFHVKSIMPDWLWEEREYVLSVCQDLRMFNFVSDKLKGDAEVAYVAVKSNGVSLKNVSSELRDNKRIVLAAVRNNGRVLKYASERLKRDKEVSKAVKRRKRRSSFVPFIVNEERGMSLRRSNERGRKERRSVERPKRSGSRKGSVERPKRKGSRRRTVERPKRKGSGRRKM